MGFVYFISNGSAIKIGTSAYPGKRAKQLATGSPTPMSVLGAVYAPDPEARERELQKQFAHLHIRAEWFRAEPPLTDFIAALPPWRPAVAPIDPIAGWLDHHKKVGWPSAETEESGDIVSRLYDMSLSRPLPAPLLPMMAEHVARLALGLSTTAVDIAGGRQSPGADRVTNSQQEAGR